MSNKREAVTANAARSEPENVPDIHSLITRSHELSQSVDWWNGAMLCMLGFAALAAFLVVITTRKVIVRSGELADVQQKIIELKEADAGLRIASAQKDAGDAHQKAGEANERATKAAQSLALAEQRAADANAKAEGFRRDIAQANEKAAEANRIAEQERLARLQLEARLADRVLLPAQEQKLVGAFARLKGKTVDVSVLGDAMEIAQFSNKIIDSLRQAGVLLNVRHPLGGSSARGVLVGVRADAPLEFKQTADEFVAILQQTVANGVGRWDFDQLVPDGAAMVSNDQGASPLSQSPLRIYIGGK